jgi:hypothetical protein
MPYRELKEVDPQVTPFVTTSVRLPADLYNLIIGEAIDNERTINKEITYLLKGAFEALRGAPVFGDKGEGKE